ncbi:hypothetical protein OG422_31215 (plasmid) [Streptomyces sp. NBC_01525]|uniref:hypothetical protein n=1 Tax=Streptomyces sp. NBC_01525 TaxID=2903893 RepID=UPI00386A7A70
MTQNAELWVGTCHGSHDGHPATVTVTRDAALPEPYGWTCTCGESRRCPTEVGVSSAAWRHTHPTRLDRLRQRAARRFSTRTTR